MQSDESNKYIDINFQCVAAAQGCQRAQGSYDGSRSTFTHENGIGWLRSSRFTADGTTLIAHDNENSLHTFILPPDLLDGIEVDILPYASVKSPTSFLSYAAHPAYNLQNTNTTWVLAGSTEMPTQLRNALDYNFSVNSYPWTNPATEAFQGAYSLAFTDGGSRFVSGSRGAIGIFDVERPGQAPIIRRNADLHLDQRSRRELILALAVSDDNFLAAGSSDRRVTIWSSSGTGEAVTTFSLCSPPGVQDDCRGDGITSISWSPCQTYLFVAERQSDHVQVFDVRKGGHRLAMLSGRQALSTQRFDIDTICVGESNEVWAGGMDGNIRMWSNVGGLAGDHKPEFTQKMHNKPIGGISWHPQQLVLATTCGGTLAAQNISLEFTSDSDSSDDELGTVAGTDTFTTSKIWAPK